MKRTATTRFLFYCSLALISVVFYLVFGINNIVKKDQEQWRQEEINQIRQSLRDQVDIAYSTVDSNYRSYQNKEYLQKYYGHRLRNIIDVAESVLKQKSESVRKGLMTDAEAKSQALEEIKGISYDSGNGYIWINDTSLPFPKMIMDPHTPDLNGKVLDDPRFNSAKGKGENLFTTMVNVCLEKNEGFVDYLWPKPTWDGMVADVPKLSYVRLYKEWNWVIGTGIYLDDAIMDGVTKSKEDLRQMRYQNGTGYFWINSTDLEEPVLIMHPYIPQIENKPLSGKLKSIVQSLARICSEKGAGFFEYTWDKPTKKGVLKDVPKVSYVKLYKPLNWIIGAGVYVDGIEEKVAEKRAIVNQQITKLIIRSFIILTTTIFAIALLIYYWQFSNYDQPAKEQIKQQADSKPDSENTEAKIELSPKDLNPDTHDKSALLAYIATLEKVHGENRLPDGIHILAEVNRLTAEVRDMSDSVREIARQTEKPEKK